QTATSDTETRYPGQADKTIHDAFRLVRQYLRQHDHDGLWSKQNIEYGFCRNLLGCRTLWLGMALCGAAFAVFYALKTGANPINAASAICALGGQRDRRWLVRSSRCS